MKNKNINFTKAIIQSLPTPLKGFDTYSDTKEGGLKLYITSNGVITFFIRRFINSKDERIIIGKYPDLSIENARQQARILKGKIAVGENPAEEKRKIRTDMTLKEFFIYYMENHSNCFKKQNSIRAELSLFKTNIEKGLGSRKMLIITKDDISALLRKIVSRGSPYTSNRVLALLRGMYNRAIEWGFPAYNPTIGIKKMGKEVSRDRFLSPEELSRFWSALDMETNLNLRGYIALLLFTGQRKTNVLSMKWQDIDFDLNIWTIYDTKNSEVMKASLSMQAIEVLNALDEHKSSEWVFPSETSKSGHIEDPKKSWHNLLNRANIQNLRLHDLRRTLGSYQAIQGSSALIIGKSLGHKSIRATEIYARLSLNPVRDSIQKATDKMLEFKKG